MSRHAALFDLDGVIIDSESRYTEFWSLIESLYPTGIDNYPVAIKGTTLETILLNYPSQQVRDDIVSRLQHFQDTMVYELYDGAETFLAELLSHGVATAMVTSSDARKMKILFSHLPQLQQYFRIIIDGSMVSRSKPDPEGYNRAAAALGVAPEDCCVFEDSLQGLRAGRAAGGKVVALATTYPRERVSDMADITIDTLARFSYDQFEALWKD